jgi:hypothetical protein
MLCVLIFDDLRVVVQAYHLYGKYLILLVSLFGMLCTGQFVYRLRPVFQAAIVGLSAVLIANVVQARKKQLISGGKDGGTEKKTN